MASDSAAVGIFAYFVMLQAVAMPVLTFSIAPSFVVSLGLTFAQSVSAQSYALQHSFVGMDFFGKDFDLYNSWDPTFGYVHYVSHRMDGESHSSPGLLIQLLQVDLPTAQQYNMINMTYVTDTGKARWGVDTTQVCYQVVSLQEMRLGADLHIRCSIPMQTSAVRLSACIARRPSPTDSLSSTLPTCLPLSKSSLPLTTKRSLC